LMGEIASGVDELGVLLMGHARGAYWYGSRLSIEQARSLAPHNNATSLQVTAAVLGGMIWAMENPARGWSKPTSSTMPGFWKSPAPIWATWLAPTAIGRRCWIAADCSPTP